MLLIAIFALIGVMLSTIIFTAVVLYVNGRLVIKRKTYLWMQGIGFIVMIATGNLVGKLLEGIASLT